VSSCSYGRKYEISIFIVAKMNRLKEIRLLLICQKFHLRNLLCKSFYQFLKVSNAIRGKTEEVVRERQEGFDRILKILIKEKVALEYLRQFLQTPNNLPYYGKVRITL
jgi:hypothetical protein